MLLNLVTLSCPKKQAYREKNHLEAKVGGFLNTSSHRVKEQQPSKKEPSPPVKLLPVPQETSPTKLADKKQH